MIHRFGRCTLDVERRELRHGEAVVPVEPQVFDLLRYLIVNRDRVVSRDDLLSAVWRGRIVSESTIGSRIAALREAIGDTGKDQRLVRTVARKGFRFVGEVHEQADGTRGPEAPAEEAAPERRVLTVLACRLADVAGLAGRLDPEELGLAIAHRVSGIRAAVEQHDGHVASHNGEDLVAYFGFPRAHENDAERAVRAARGVLEEISARIGIATGLVVVGEPAPGGNAFGEAPLLAHRLRDACDSDAVAICASTRRSIGNLFECRELDGGGAWQVVRESASSNRFAALRPQRAALVGRGEEMELLLRRWRQAMGGEGRAVLVCGEPGIGKSRLVAALADALAAEGAACARFDCSPHRVDTALHPVIAHLDDAAGIGENDGDEERLRRLATLLAEAGSSDARDVTLFAELLSIPAAGGHAPLAISAQLRKELLLDRFLAYLAGRARRHPLLVVLEDAHWIDPTSGEIFETLIGTCRMLPVLFVLTHRPEYSPPWLGHAHVTALRLNRLGRSDIASLVRQVAGDRELPGALVEQILERTDGVPLFVEEVTKSVLESGAAQSDLAVPATLQASLVARLDRLGKGRPLAQTCAALGREFRYGLVHAVTLLPDAELEARLGQLVASGLVHQRGSPPFSVYTFKHALVQDAAYGTMLKSQRAQLHERIANVLSARFPDMVEHHPDILALHCREAGLWQDAIAHAMRAARMALDRSAGLEAQAHVERALAVLPDVEEGALRKGLEGRLRGAFGEALIMTQGFGSPRVEETLSKARDLIDEREYPVEAVRALGGLFNYHLIRSESPLCLALAEPLLERSTERPVACVAQYFVGAAHLHLGNFEASIRHLEIARDWYDEDACRPLAFVAAGTHLHSFTLIWLGLGYLYAGSAARGAETIAEAVADARSRSHPFTLVSALLAQARFLSQLGDLAAAIAATEEGLRIAAEQRSPYHLSRASVLRAINVVDSGRPREGIELLEEALAAHRKTGANFQSSYNLTRLADAHAQAGDVQRALELADEALAEVGRTGERWWEAEALRWKGEILLRSSARKRAEAERCFRAALDCARHQRAKLWERSAAQSLASLWRREGRGDDARALLATVRG